MADLPSIQYTPEYMSKLRRLVHSEKERESYGYVLVDLSEEQLSRKKKCIHCGKSVRRSLDKDIPEKISKDRAKCYRCFQSGHIARNCPAELTTVSETVKQDGDLKSSLDPQESRSAPVSIMCCKFHPGEVFNKV
jgi:hypothetical protein